MRSLLWILDPSLSREQAEALLGSLVARDLAATLREVPGGLVVVVDDPPAGTEPPAGVLRSSTVDVPTASQLTRRNFLDTFAVGLSVAALATGTVFAGMYASPPPPRREDVDEMDVGSAVEIRSLGSRLFRFGREPCIVVAAGDGFHALSTVCTHLGCLVQWVPDSRQLACPCHRATYDLEGNVLEGPPPRPLRTFAVVLRDDRVVVRRRTAS